MRYTEWEKMWTSDRKEALEILGVETTEKDRHNKYQRQTKEGAEWDRRVSIAKALGKKAYHEYLRSPEWQVKREAVLRRDDYKCQICNDTERLHVHHLTYKRKFNEPLYDLVTLCETCHKIAHMID